VLSTVTNVADERRMTVFGVKHRDESHYILPLCPEETEHQY